MATVKQTSRRKFALGRLRDQLEKGTKNTAKGVVPLTEKDTKRIEKEIKNLESKT